MGTRTQERKTCLLCSWRSLEGNSRHKDPGKERCLSQAPPSEQGQQGQCSGRIQTPKFYTNRRALDPQQCTCSRQMHTFLSLHCSGRQSLLCGAKSIGTTEASAQTGDYFHHSSTSHLPHLRTSNERVGDVRRMYRAPPG